MAKSKINYIDNNGNWITYREKLKPFAPTKKEFLDLKDKISEIIGQNTTAEFDDILDYLITFMREKAYIQATSRSITSVRKELKTFAKHIKKLRHFMDHEFSDLAQHHISHAKMATMSKYDISDPVYSMFLASELSLNICEQANESLKGYKGKFTVNDMRQILAEELARELSKMDVELTKYRDGVFAKCLIEVLNMIPSQVHGVALSVAIPSDIFSIISSAIDEFPKKEPFSLLNIE